MFISQSAINRPVTTILLTAVILLFGVMTLSDMGVDLMPEIDIPVVTVSAVLVGADAEILDRDVAEILEREINTIEGIDSLRSFSSEGRTRVVVEFDLERDVDVAAQEVRDQVDIAKRDLPQDLEAPVVQKLDIEGGPIMFVALSSEGDYQEMATYADDVIRERLQTVSGVGSAQLEGFRERQIRVWLDPTTLEAYNLSPTDVSRAIQAKHMELPGGRIENADQEYAVKVQGEYESLDEFRNLVVHSGDGRIVQLSDVASVTDGSEDLRSIARFNGRPSVSLGIQRQTGANTVAVANEVRQAVEELQEDLPQGMTLAVTNDNARYIERAIGDGLFDLFFGACLAAVVILVFLRNFRMAFISIMAIPTAILGSFIAIYFMGFTVNMITTLAMALAMGLVIDDAVVMLENIFRHVEQEGKSAMQAAREGAAEVGAAVIAAASAIITVFVPVAFMGGIIGQVFFEFGLSIAMAVAISLVAALTLTPMLCSRLLKHTDEHGRVFRMLETAFQRIEQAYRSTLAVAVRRRWATLGIAFVVFVAGLALVPFANVGFMTQADEGQFVVSFEWPPGTAIHQTDAGMRRIEEMVLEIPEVERVMATLGGQGQTVNEGQVYVEMTPASERDRGIEEILSLLRERAAGEFPGARRIAFAVAGGGGPGQQADLEYILQGPDIRELDAVAQTMADELRDMEGYVDVDTDLRLEAPEVQVTINRDLANNIGVDVATISQNLNILFGGQDVATFDQGGRQYDIRMRALPQARREPDQLLDVALRNPSAGGGVPSPAAGGGGMAAAGMGAPGMQDDGGPGMINMANLIHFEEDVGPQSINRYGRQYAVTLSANLEGVSLGEGMETMEALSEQYIPDDPAWGTALTGEADMLEESFGHLLTALFIAIVLIYVVLGSQFESFVHPFTILMSLPMAIVGGIGFLLVTGSQLDILAFIGFIMLTGIVSKNAILLVDFINQRRDEGMERDEAIRTAAPLRLRPILMTALTTMAAMTPVALAFGEGGEMRAPMGVAVIGGLFSATLLTLFVIPCVYTVLDDFSGWFRRSAGRFAASNE
ncbi:MAG: efflux RND transporter permease subunit [Candidatus Hydrogenedentota bacterium]